MMHCYGDLLMQDEAMKYKGYNEPCFTLGVNKRPVWSSDVWIQCRIVR